MNTPQIEIENISFRYDIVPVLKNISLTINQCDFLGITGANGGGKTSLLRIILGLLTPTTGKINFFSKNQSVTQLRMGYLPQKNAIDYQFPISVYEVVASGLLQEKSKWKGFSPQQKEMIEYTLDRVELTHVASRPIGNLSGGQQQRALFARALVGHPEVLILDEPTSYIDKSFESHMQTILKEENQHSTILFVSHDIDAVSKLSNRIVDIHESLSVIK